MDYRLATAQRGPDHRSEEAAYWKHYVITPLRWFAAMIQEQNPYEWSIGDVTNPRTVLFGLAKCSQSNDIEKARNFATSKDGLHIRNHATDAFEYLIHGTSQSELAKELYEKLKIHGLL